MCLRHVLHACIMFCELLSWLRLVFNAISTHCVLVSRQTSLHGAGRSMMHANWPSQLGRQIMQNAQTGSLRSNHSCHV